MAPGLPDRVDYVRLAAEGARLERVYPQDAMPRLRDVLADMGGLVAASFEFAKLSTGRPGATVAVKAEVWLTCQRCLKGFAFPVDARSEIEFAADEFATSEAKESQREVYAVRDGLVSLRELAEEELLLALPIVAMCVAPDTCGQAADAPEASFTAAGTPRDMSGERSRPFAVLQDLLKKT
jgi:uncharacterized protein